MSTEQRAAVLGMMACLEACKKARAQETQKDFTQDDVVDEEDEK